MTSFEVIVGPDRAHADDADSALYAADRLVSEAAQGYGARRLVRRDVIVTRDGIYDGRLTTLARAGAREER